MLTSINIELLAEFLSRKTCPNSALSQREREFNHNPEHTVSQVQTQSRDSLTTARSANKCAYAFKIFASWRRLQRTASIDRERLHFSDCFRDVFRRQSARKNQARKHLARAPGHRRVNNLPGPAPQLRVKRIKHDRVRFIRRDFSRVEGHIHTKSFYDKTTIWPYPLHRAIKFFRFVAM